MTTPLSYSLPLSLPPFLSQQEIGGDTAEFMGHLIKLRADRMAINITVNSIGTPLNEVRPVDGRMYLHVCASAFAFHTIYIHLHNPPHQPQTSTPPKHSPRCARPARSSFPTIPHTHAITPPHHIYTHTYTQSPPPHINPKHPHTPKNQPSMRATRQKLFPAVGYLYPAGSQKLADVTDESQIEGALSAVPEYQKLYNSISVRGFGVWVWGKGYMGGCVAHQTDAL